MAIDLENQVGYNLNRTALLFRRELIRSLRSFNNMTPEQWQAMNILWQSKEGLTPTYLSEVTLQDLPALSRMIKRMEENGWVKRIQDQEDKRSFRIALTQEGKKLEKSVPKALLGHFETVLNVLNPAEQKGLISSLKKLRKALGDSI